jgi:hypothetical protein
MNLANATLVSLATFGYSAAGRPVAGASTTVNARVRDQRCQRRPVAGSWAR